MGYLTPTVVNAAWELWDGTETVTYLHYTAATDTVANTGTDVLALGRVISSDDVSLPEEAIYNIERRRWHLRKLTLDAALVYVVKRSVIRQASGRMIVKIAEVALGTRYVCETVELPA